MQTYARPEAVDAGHAKYAANITGKILTYFEDLFDIEYEPSKLGKTLCGYNCTDLGLHGLFFQ